MSIHCSLPLAHSLPSAEPAKPDHLQRMRHAAVLPAGEPQASRLDSIFLTMSPLSRQGASNVRCALCNGVTPVPPAGSEMAQLECGGCRTQLCYIRGASSVQCSVCNTVNLAMQGAPLCESGYAALAHALPLSPRKSGGTRQLRGLRHHADVRAPPCCRDARLTPLRRRYAYGAQSVKCAVCNFVTAARLASMLPYARGLTPHLLSCREGLLGLDTAAAGVSANCVALLA